MDQKTLNQLEKLLQEILNKSLANLVTKGDAKAFLKKDDLQNFATKDDLKKFITKDDAKNFVTKDDLYSLKKELLVKLNKLDEMQMAIFKTVDKVKEDKQTVKSLDARVTKLEREVFA